MSIHNGAENLLLLRRPAVERLTGKSRATIYADIKAGRFPAPIKIGAQASAWLASEIDGWLAARVAERDARRLETEV